MAKETPNVYRSLKWLSQAYEERLRDFNKRVKAGEINGEQEMVLKRDLAFNLNFEVESLAGKIDDGDLDVCKSEVSE